jgi:MFS family permease
LNTTFRSLRGYNYRIWFAGGLVSNVGTWMQRTAQDWLVLTELTHNNATAVGIVMALQFGPQVLLLPWTGMATDRLEQRKLLMATQAGMGVLALGLGLLTLAGWVQLWEVYLFALMLGCVSAFDSPARQTFVGQLVGETDLSNAVALNSTSFNAARMIGPAVAGVLIGTIGTGWVFMLNGLSFAAVLLSLTQLRAADLHPIRRAATASLREGFQYVLGRPDLVTPLVMFGILGTFGWNFPIFISTMAVSVFHVGASKFGLLTSMMAIGSVMGALSSAHRTRPHMGIVVWGALAFGICCAVAAVMPSLGLFGMALMGMGLAAQTFSTSTNGLVQLSTEPAMRGRVMAILLALAMGGTPIGAPMVGWVADHASPRWALGVGALAGLVATLFALYRQSQLKRQSDGLHDPIDGQDFARGGRG